MKFSTKLLIGLFIFLILVIGIYFLALRQVDYDFVIVNDNEMIPEEACAKLNDQILVVLKTGCAGCSKVEPILKEIEEEENLEFKYFNVAIKEQSNELMSMGFVPQYVPSIVVDCKVYSGPLSKERYLQILGK